SYARVSYARELLGDVGGAAHAMRLAIDAAAGQPEALVVADPAGKAVLVSGTSGGFRASVPLSARGAPGLRLRVRRARAGGGRARPDSQRHRVRAASSGCDPAAAVRRFAR